MATRTALLVRILSTLLLVICLFAPAGAQHGGGGGHFGGGHFGGGHSSGRQSNRGRHFGWLRFRFGKHSGRSEEIGARYASNSLPHLPSDLLNTTSSRVPSLTRIPPTLLWSPPLFSRRPGGQFSSIFRSMHTRGFVFNRFARFPSSGCFFDGVTQLCFFAPFLPLFSCYGDFDPFYPGYSPDIGDDLNSTQVLSEMSVTPPTAYATDEEITDENSSKRPGATLVVTTGDRVLDKGVFLLVLNNGASHAVTDYWVADGYLEYISPNGTRSHVPLDTLDLQSTVMQNAPRGLPFVLRFAPAQNR